MHDLDRPMFEAGQLGEYEAEGVFGETALGETVSPELLEMQQLLAGEVTGETGFGGQGEVLEMELASELLEVTNEAELEQFLGDLWNRAKSVYGTVAPAASQALGQLARRGARAALPAIGAAAGKAAGRYFAPDWLDPYAGPAGTAAGRWAGTKLADVLGLELEGVSQEDREFEGAKALVRWLMDAYRRAAVAPPTAPPAAVAKSAAVAAAQRTVPGLAPVIARMPVTAGPGGGLAGAAGGQSGRWVRRGNSVVLLGL
jgi:hypothetical protein